MRRRGALALLVCLATWQAVQIQAQNFTRTELGFDTSVLHPGHPFSSTTDVGVGGRFTYNFTPSFSIDSQLDYYTTNLSRFSTQAGGRAIVGLVGPKAGIRTRAFGFFFKARPGFMSFSQVPSSAFGLFPTARKTHAALDLGGVAEFYVHRSLIFRMDAGQLLVRYGDALLQTFPGGVSKSIGTIGGPWHLNFGASYRLGSTKTDDEGTPETASFAAGGQYSLFTSQRGLDTVRDESGIGGFFTWNFSRYFALDSSVTFFPRKIHIADFQQGGRMFQALAGMRGGIRRGRLGIFAKFRPGIQRYSSTEQNAITFQDTPFTDMAFDAGGVIEVYTSRRSLLRFDAGNTSIFYRPKDIPLANGGVFHAAGFTSSTIQITAGIGFRF